MVGQTQHMAGLVRGDADRVVLLALRVVEEDVPAAVTVRGGVRATRVVALVVPEVGADAEFLELDVRDRAVPDLGARGFPPAEARRVAGVVANVTAGAAGFAVRFSATDLTTASKNALVALASSAEP